MNRMASGDRIDSIELETDATTASTAAIIPKSNIPSVDSNTSNDKIVAVASTSNQYKIATTAAYVFGGDDSMRFSQSEAAAIAANQAPKLSSSSTLDATVTTIGRTPSTSVKHTEKKIGHRRVDEGGEVTYKKIQSKQIMGSIQLGIQHTVGSLASKPKRDLLMNDFWEVETIAFPPDGSSITPAHHYSDFTFKVYAPIAFRYFRDLFGIAPDDFLMSMCAAPLRQLSNPGASGSIFYLTDDDEFIVKTVQRKEGEFLQKLLPGYYMNLSQNPRTLLPKFFGLYCFHYNSKNVRLVAMNNLLPSEVKMHAKYDLKGSTFRRKASKAERQKSLPTYKDLDFMEHFPNGIFLETDKYNALMKTIQRDCMVLESFQIMDYSLLVGIHNLDTALKERREERIRNARLKLQRNEDAIHVEDTATEADQGIASAVGGGGGGATALNRTRSMNRQRLVINSTPMESIQADNEPFDEEEDVPAGGIPARSENDERLLLYIGIIDILQSYRLEKKLEHTFKSIIYNGDTVSVCRPSYYAQRFQNFMGKTVFKKTPTFPLKHSPPKRKPSTANMNSSRLPALRTPGPQPQQQQQQQQQPQNTTLLDRSRPQLISGSSTPPPAFDEISSDDVTANRGASGSRFRRSIARSNASTSASSTSASTSAMAFRQISYVSSDCSDTEEEIHRTSVQVSTSSFMEMDEVNMRNSEKKQEEIVVVEKIGMVQPVQEDKGNDNIELSGDEPDRINSGIAKTVYLSTLVVGDVKTS